MLEKKGCRNMFQWIRNPTNQGRLSNHKSKCWLHRRSVASFKWAKISRLSVCKLVGDSAFSDLWLSTKKTTCKYSVTLCKANDNATLTL